jgi:hypothetical protein
MKLYIQVENGLPVNHPALEENLIGSLGGVPENWKKFVRVAPPELGVYEVYVGVTYELRSDDAYTDVHHSRKMTNEEITAKQEEVKSVWATLNNGFTSWNFSEALCAYVPPVAKPQDGNRYAWRESNLSWVFMPAPPTGEGWTFNVETGLWEKV